MAARGTEPPACPHACLLARRMACLPASARSEAPELLKPCQVADSARASPLPCPVPACRAQRRAQQRNSQEQFSLGTLITACLLCVAQCFWTVIEYLTKVGGCCRQVVGGCACGVMHQVGAPSAEHCGGGRMQPAVARSAGLVCPCSAAHPHPPSSPSRPVRRSLLPC